MKCINGSALWQYTVPLFFIFPISSIGFVFMVKYVVSQIPVLFAILACSLVSPVMINSYLSGTLSQNNLIYKLLSVMVSYHSNRNITNANTDLFNYGISCFCVTLTEYLTLKIGTVYSASLFQTSVNLDWQVFFFHSRKSDCIMVCQGEEKENLKETRNNKPLKTHIPVTYILSPRDLLLKVLEFLQVALKHEATCSEHDVCGKHSRFK